MDTNILLETGTNELEILEFRVANNFYGIRNTKLISAVGLDIDGADPEKIISDAISGLSL